MKFKQLIHLFTMHFYFSRQYISKIKYKLEIKQGKKKKLVKINNNDDASFKKYSPNLPKTQWGGRAFKRAKCEDRYWPIEWPISLTFTDTKIHDNIKNK